MVVGRPNSRHKFIDLQPLVDVMNVRFVETACYFSRMLVTDASTYVVIVSSLDLAASEVAVHLHFIRRLHLIEG